MTAARRGLTQGEPAAGERRLGRQRAPAEALPSRRPLQEPGPCHQGQAAVPSPRGQSSLWLSQARRKGLELLSSSAAAGAALREGPLQGAAVGRGCGSNRRFGAAGSSASSGEGCWPPALAQSWLPARQAATATSPPPPPVRGAEYAASD